MFDRCLRQGALADAHVDLAALTNLAALLRHVLNDRFTSSNAPLSGVSRDQNRGELHATPNEAGAATVRHNRSTCSQQNRRR
jgi:hypothetical protein